VSFSAAHDVKEQIRDAIDIVDLVGGYLELRRQGRIYVAHCPWHDDSRPSLQVNPERQSWKCWVCDIGGDVFSFVMQREGVEFREALTMLAERAGIALTPRQGGPKGGQNDKQSLYQTVAWAEQQFHECLLNSPEAEPARQYLRNRGIEDASIRRFRLGFSPDRWQWMLDRAMSASVSPALLEAVDLVVRSSSSGRHYDRFKGRVIFPIRDTQDRPIAFGGRILPDFADDKSAKYVNSRETRLFSKSHQLYGLNVVRDAVAKKRHALVVEGYTDVIAAFQYGVDNVVAVLGTALGAGHIRLLRRFADVVTLVLDGDEAGQRRTNEVLELFVAQQLDLRIVTLPGGLDPCDYLIQHGLEEFEQRIVQAPDALDHKIHIATEGVDLSRDTHRANRALEEILTTLAKSPGGGVDAGQTRLRQQQVLSRLSREFRVDEAELRTRLRSLRRAPAKSARGEGNPAAIEAPGLDTWERNLFELLTQRPELAVEAIRTIPAGELQTGGARALWELYVSFCDQGEVPEFGRILTALDDPTLKNLLVEIDESAQSKSFDNAGEHLQGLITAFERRAQERQSRDVISALESKELTEEQQLSVLHDLIDKQRRKHDRS
jgi:DNA primase